MRTIIIAAFALLIATPVQAQWNPQAWTVGPLAPTNQAPMIQPYVPPTTWTGQTYGNSNYWRSNNGQSFSCQTYGNATYCR